MEQPRTLPTIARVTFIVHLVVAVLDGLPLLLIPARALALFGYPPLPQGLGVPFRAYGALIFAFGGLTSFYGIFAKSWERVDYIVRGEILFLAIQTVLFALAGILGRSPALGNWFFAALSAVLLALFVSTFVNRPK